MLLHDAFDAHARSRGANLFAHCGDVELTYGAALDRSLAMAAALVRAGVKGQDRIGLIQRNSIDGLLLMMAASRIGAVIVPVNYRLSPQEWVDLIVDADARIVFADPDFAQQVDEAIADGAPQATVRTISMAVTLSGREALDDFLGEGRPFAVPATVHREDVVFQMYTSGTTGRAKGALLTHAGMVANIVKFNFAVPYHLNPGDRTLVVLPLFHIAAIATAMGAIANGASLIMHRDVDPGAIAASLRDDHIVTVGLVPAVIQMLVAVKDIEDMRFPALRCVLYGASPIAAPLLSRAIGVFGCDFVQGYGMTESCGVATLLNEVDHRRAVDDDPGLLLSAGRALPGTDLRILSFDGEELAIGEVGEILIRGEDLLAGYWKLSEATDAVLKDGWFHTGDAGYLDADGYLYIRDRVKDMIVTGAENVYPVEVEAWLFEHPAVADVAVIGVPDDRWGETVMAVIVLKDGHLPSVDELDGFCRQRLGGFKIPKRYEFRPTLPRNAAGKVLKRDLRQEYWKDQTRSVG